MPLRNKFRVKYQKISEFIGNPNISEIRIYQKSEYIRNPNISEIRIYQKSEYIRNPNLSEIRIYPNLSKPVKLLFEELKLFNFFFQPSSYFLNKYTETLFIKKFLSFSQSVIFTWITFLLSWQSHEIFIYIYSSI